MGWSWTFLACYDSCSIDGHEALLDLLDTWDFDMTIDDLK